MTSLAEARSITYSEALREALREEMERDATVVAMGQDIRSWGEEGGVFGVTKGLLGEFGSSRIRDTPISEEGMVGLGVGAAMTGLRPVVELMYGDFLTHAMEPLVNQAAKVRYMFGGQARVPLVVRTNLGASGGKAAQHSQSLESWLVHVPGLKVVVPATPADAKGLLKTAIRDDNPVVFLEHKLLYFAQGPVPEGEEDPLPFGRARVAREGQHVTVVATHVMLHHALAVAEELAGEGIEIEVIDPRTLVPFDLETVLGSVAKTTRLVVCHEAVERAGWGGEVVAQVTEHAFGDLDAPVLRVCGRNLPMPYAEPLEKVVVPGREEIAAAVRQVLEGSDLSPWRGGVR